MSRETNSKQKIERTALTSTIPIPQIFDRTGAVRSPPLSGLLREALSFATYHPVAPDISDLPDGGGRRVLVVPPYLTNDAFTRPLRHFLTRCGYQPEGWNLGINWGPTVSLRNGLRRRLIDLATAEGGPVSIVGISLGGVLARDIAYDEAPLIRHLVTIVSPFHLPTASPIKPLFHLSAKLHDFELDTARLAQPLPVPSTAIYTRDDGLVAWESCRGEAGDGTAFEVSGRHVAICRNPDVLRIVAQRLGSTMS